MAAGHLNRMEFHRNVYSGNLLEVDFSCLFIDVLCPKIFYNQHGSLSEVLSQHTGRELVTTAILGKKTS